MSFEEQIETLKQNLNDLSSLAMLMGTLTNQEVSVLKEMIVKTKKLEEPNMIFPAPLPKEAIGNLEKYIESAEFNAKQFASTALLLKKVVNDLEVKD